MSTSLTKQNSNGINYRTREGEGGGGPPVGGQGDPSGTGSGLNSTATGFDPGAARDGRSRTFTNANARQARLLCLTAFSNSHRSFTLTNASRMRATASLELLNDTFTCMCSRLALNHLASSCARMHQWRVSLRHSHARVTDPLRITSRNSFSNALKTGHRAPGEGALGNKPKYPRMVQHSQLTVCPSHHHQESRSAKRRRLQDANCIFRLAQLARRSP